ncbi:MAG: hypothetical protein H6562_10565 [Lewinellaceae bacterium]|nr:hypothetical protein [Lewinellaceae bacterium]
MQNVKCGSLNVKVAAVSCFDHFFLEWPDEIFASWRLCAEMTGLPFARDSQVGDLGSSRIGGEPLAGGLSLGAMQNVKCGSLNVKVAAVIQFEHFLQKWPNHGQQ